MLNECEILRDMFQQERQKNSNTLKEIAKWFEELVRNPVKLEPIMRQYFFDHIAPIFFAALGEVKVVKEVKVTLDNIKETTDEETTKE